MSLGVYRFLIFWPQGDIEEYAGMKFPDPLSYPVGTWLYDRTGATAGVGWIQLVQYTAPISIGWEQYTSEASALHGVTKHIKMLALVMQ